MSRNKFLKVFKNQSEYDDFMLTSEDKVLPNVSLIEDTNEVFYTPMEVSLENQYFTIVSQEDGNEITCSLNTSNSSYSANGSEWQSFSGTEQKIYLNKGGFVKIKSISSGGSVGNIKGTKKYFVEGNIMSLIFGDNFSDKKSLVVDGISYNFSSFFENEKSLVDASHLVLPAETLSPSCYMGMFSSCSNLKNSPQELPATTLTGYCYQMMFKNCSGLLNSPKIFISSITGEYSCSEMFYNCSSLKKIDYSDADTFSIPSDAKYCYDQMFRKCKSLTSFPELNSTTTSAGCYRYMFCECTSLIDGPTKLLATELQGLCYSNMFKGCSKLRKSPEMRNISKAGMDCCRSMFEGCSTINNPLLTITSTAILSNSSFSGMFNGCSSINTLTRVNLSALTLSNHCYYQMFFNCSLLSRSPELPATTLASYCYCEMFTGCESLVYGPNQLPARKLEEGCYYKMFSGCSNLISTFMEGSENTTTSSPEKESSSSYSLGGQTRSDSTSTPMPIGSPEDCFLSATEMAKSSCELMFEGCSSLTFAPQIIAQSLADNCCSGMFYECRSMTTTQKILPALTLSTGCYKEMYFNCCSLKSAPNLPATTLSDDCYFSMFSGCTALEEVPTTLPATELSTGCYRSMFENCINIEKAPILPAECLVNKCYEKMFHISNYPEKSSINYINIAAYRARYEYVDDTTGNPYTVEIDLINNSSDISPAMDSWLGGLGGFKENGVFYINSNIDDRAYSSLMLDVSHGTGLIPSDWTIVMSF